METTFSTDGLKFLFRYPLQGKEWGRKMLYLGLFWLAGWFIPVIPWLFAGGYMAAIIRQAAAGEPLKDLPEWQDWNRLLLDGVRLLGAGLIYALPVIVLFTAGWSAYMGSMFAGIGLGEAGHDFLPAVMMLGSMAVLFCSMALGIVVSLALGIAYFPALSHMVVKESFGAFFKVREWFAVLRANLWGYLVAFILLIGLSFAVQLLTQVFYFSIILCLALPVLFFVSMPYLSVITSVLLGQVYKEGAEALALAAPQEDAVE